MSQSEHTKGSIKVENLNVHYGERHALKNLNIEIPKNKLSG